MIDIEFEKEWDALLHKLKGQFGEDIDLQAILFLIGIQELGKGHQKFSKDQKLDVMHIAICTLLSSYGYYEYNGMDKDGWPHWKINNQLPPLKPAQQGQLIRQAIIDYFRNKEIVN